MKSNTVILIVITLLVAGGAYWYFFMGAGNQPPLTASSMSDNSAQTQFQTLVNELQPISFNTTIFSDPSFTSLIDITIPVTPESFGRPDVFAVISATPTTVGK